MTTRVQVDAHAGWPVRVQAIDTGPVEGEIVQSDLGIVPALASQNFHVFKGRQLLITELPRET